ncbi:MAG: ABC transporter ATP-binding protein [Thermodesulfovibrionales bacterium]|nr:ABC transporter ATP-binding protein [Thermodesulfovibrionales bacterium]
MKPTKESLLVLKNVDVHYGKIHAIKHLSLHVNKGEIVALIGSNGAGKTTLLAAISGLLRVTSGSIKYAGVEIANKPTEEIVKRGISLVPERGLVFKPLTVEDNLLLGAYHLYSFGKNKEVKSDIEQIYKMFPVLKERRKQLAGTLSGGEQQMLAIGRALMAKPKMLLLDEPSMGLAPMIVREILLYIKKLRDEHGLTVLLVEQNARSALKIADKGYVLETGRVLLQGTSEELLANRDVQRAYLGRDLAIN